MIEEKEYYRIAIHMIHIAIITGDERAVTHVLQQHFAVLPLPDEQFHAELQEIMAVYSTLLSHLNIPAAAMHPEFLGLRELIKRALEKPLQDE